MQGGEGEEKGGPGQELSYLFPVLGTMTVLASLEEDDRVVSCLAQGPEASWSYHGCWPCYCLAFGAPGMVPIP